MSCRDCKERTPGCHDRCRKHKAESIYQAVIKAKRKEEKEAYNERTRRSIEVTERQRRRHGR